VQSNGPVGGLPLELTAAVKVIVCPTLDEFGPEVSMVVPALLTFLRYRAGTGGESGVTERRPP
jgi:hypothetical protein